MKKRILSLTIMVAMLSSLIACGGKEENNGIIATKATTTEQSAAGETKDDNQTTVKDEETITFVDEETTEEMTTEDMITEEPTTEKQTPAPTTEKPTPAPTTTPVQQTTTTEPVDKEPSAEELKQIESIKKRNNAYRELLLTGDYMNYKLGTVNLFNVIDINGDGVEELFVNDERYFDGDRYVTHIFAWVNESILGIGGTQDILYYMYYCPSTGVIIDPFPKPYLGDYYKIERLSKFVGKSDKLWESIPFDKNVIACGDGKMYPTDDSVKANEPYAGEELKELQEIFRENAPTVEKIESKYELTTENLDKYLPTDDEVILAKLRK